MVWKLKNMFSRKTKEKKGKFKDKISGTQKKVRIDLIIFGVLIFILGIFLGVFIGVGISEGEISFSSFQRFLTTNETIDVLDISEDDSQDLSSEGIIVNPNVIVNSGSEGSGMSGGGKIETGGSGTSTVTQIDKNPDSSSEYIEPDSDSYYIPPPPVDD